jgi:hypothetical protein
VSCPESSILVGPKAERRWVLWFGLIVLIITSLPYMIGFFRQGDAWRFTGFVFGIEDGNSYIGKMLSGAFGAWLFRTPYTTMLQQGVVAFIPYLLLGKLAAGAGLHEQLIVLFQVFRIAGGILAILATYDFLSLFIVSIDLRRFGLALCILGGGLGWLAVVLGSRSLPLDFYSPETFGFLGIFGIPHLALARATFLWALVIYLRFVIKAEARWWRQSLCLGFLWLATTITQPITALVLGVVIGLHCLVTGLWQVLFKRNEKDGIKKWRGIVLMVVVSFILPAPLLLYTYFSFSIDPFLKAWTLQNIIRSPEPIQYLIAYGLVLPFAIVGVLRLLRLDIWKGLFFAAWVMALPLLAYAPFNLQRRLLEGMWVALVTLSMVAFEGWRAGSSAGTAPIFVKKPYWSRWIFLLAFPSTIVLLSGALLTSWRPSLPVFRLKEETDAFEYLKQSASPGDVILASFDTSNALPAWAPLRVVAGHGPESVGLAELRPRVEAFYSSATSDEERKRLLQEQKVRFVIWGPLERRLGDWDPEKASYMEKVYDVGEFKIYEITPDLNL